MSFKGTPVNMAPEIFKTNKRLTESYDKKCDIWSLGTILYEMLFGRIIGSNIKTMKDLQKFLLSETEISLPTSEGISNSCKNLLTKMLRKNPVERIGIEEVLKHDWFNPVKENSLNTSLLIKSFYNLSRSQNIKEIDPNIMEKEGLRKFICLQYELKLKDCLVSLCGQIVIVVNKIKKVKNIITEHGGDLYPFDELSLALDGKIIGMIEKLSNIQTGVVNNKTDFTGFVRKTIDKELKKRQIYTEYKEAKKTTEGYFEDSNQNQEELTIKIHNHFFNLGEKLLQNEDLAEDEEEIKNILELEKALLLMVDIVRFDFLSIFYEIKFHKDLKNISFDVYDINNFIEFLGTVDEDEFVEFDKFKPSKFNDCFSLKVGVDFLVDYPNKDIHKAIDIFKGLLEKKLNTDKEMKAVD